MAVREVTTPLKLVRPEEPAPAPPSWGEADAARVQAIALMTALAHVLAARLVLLTATLGLIGLTAFAEYQHSVAAVVAACLFAVFGLIPIVALAIRKG